MRSYLRLRWWLAPVLLTLLALTIRLPHLTGSFWLDEAAQALESARPLSEQLNISQDFQPPLLHLIVHAAVQVSRSEWWLRFWAALLPGVLTVTLIYAIGSKLNSTIQAQIAALLLATHSFHLFYSQELRPYALPAALATATWFLLVRNQRQPPSQASCWWWVGLTSAGWYSSYLYPFVTLGQLAYAWWLWPKFRSKVLSGIALVVLLFFPWLPFLKTQLNQGQLVQSQLPGWSQVVGQLPAKSLALTGGKWLFGVVDLEPNLWFGLSAVLAGGLFIYLALVKKAWRRPEGLLFLCWVIIPLGLIWLTSFFIPILQPKRVLALLPGWLLFVAWLSLPLPKPSSTSTRWVGGTFLALLLALNVVGTLQYYRDARLQREDWRGLYERLTTTYPASNSIAVFAFDQPFAPWIWYDHQGYPSVSLGTLHVQSEEQVRAQLKPIAQKQYSLVFDYLTDLTDPQHRVQAEVEAYGFKQSQVIDQPLIGFVRVYAKPTAVLSDRSEAP